MDDSMTEYASTEKSMENIAVPVSNTTDGKHHYRRLVVLIGPPKTGSTSLQDFLARYASKHGHGANQVKAFQDWNYPLFLGKKTGIQELQHGYGSPSYIRIRDKFLRQSPSFNLVVGSEYLIHYNQFLNDNLFRELSNWTGSVPEIVIQSRSPRTSHLVSIWKQQTQLKGKPSYGWSFRRYLCDSATQQSVQRRIGGFANPLGIAHQIIHHYHIPAIVMDMGGISKQGLDLCHAFSCSVLKVKCTSDKVWVEGLEGVTIHSNSRNGDTGVAPEEFQQMESVFHQRDCSYYDELHNHSLFHLLYRHDRLWADDCADTAQTPSFRYNVTIMLEAFRGILQCPGYERVPQLQHAITTPNEAELVSTAQNESSDTWSDSTTGAIRMPDSNFQSAVPNVVPFQSAAYTVLLLLAAILGSRLYAKRRNDSLTSEAAPHLQIIVLESSRTKVSLYNRHGHDIK